MRSARNRKDRQIVVWRLPVQSSDFGLPRYAWNESAYFSWRLFVCRVETKISAAHGTFLALFSRTPESTCACRGGLLRRCGGEALIRLFFFCWAAFFFCWRGFFSSPSLPLPLFSSRVM